MARQSTIQRGIFSIEKGARLIEVLTRQGGGMTLSALAQAAELAPSIAHRYLVSLMRSALVEQLGNGLYDLGPLTLAAGLAKLSRQDEYRVGLRFLDQLAERTRETVLMTLWTGHGVVVVRWLESPHLLTIHVRPGANLPLLNSASGRLFAAFLPPRVTEPTLTAERAAGGVAVAPDGALSEAEFAQELEEIRARGQSRVMGGLAPGVGAMAAPVFAAGGEIALGFAIVGPMGTLDTAWEGEPARILREMTAACTRALGGMAPA
ncbi:IclR family transcriptional regulator [Acidocella sp.]|uniref:IclR family transcriptional regulator n=1 Tax=Acidocella sp. TaxID=50710 RepID=UPI002625C7A0|nr:IclR family transcriptional regulator [Acidocella sp.]